MKPTLSARAIPYFVEAGWNAGRMVSVDAGVPSDHPAHEVLARFGQLHVGVGPDGEMLDEIDSDIDFGYRSGLRVRMDEWGRLLDTTLVGIGEIHHSHGELYVSNDGRFFVASLIHDAIGFAGDFRAAIDGLLFGVRPIPMIRPDQRAMHWGGIEYRHGDPG